MKIQVVKKGSSKVKTMAVCPWIVEVPPEASKANS
jgi:hypothetical protein